jgi:hypothetical protein
VTHRDLVAGNVGQKTAGVHVARRFQQLQGRRVLRFVARVVPAFLPAVIARFFAPFVSWFF